MAITCRVILSYCFVQFCFNAIYGQFPTYRTNVFVNTLKMPLGTMSAIVTAAMQKYRWCLEYWFWSTAFSDAVLNRCTCVYRIVSQSPLEPGPSCPRHC